jgi:hypothetical protein
LLYKNRPIKDNLAIGLDEDQDGGDLFFAVVSDLQATLPLLFGRKRSLFHFGMAAKK